MITFYLAKSFNCLANNNVIMEDISKATKRFWIQCIYLVKLLMRLAIFYSHAKINDFQH